MGPDFVHTICLEALGHFPKRPPWKFLQNQGIAGFMFFSDPVSWIAMLWSNHGWSIRCLDGAAVCEKSGVSKGRCPG